jgi:hypothetical protein
MMPKESVPAQQADEAPLRQRDNSCQRDGCAGDSRGCDDDIRPQTIYSRHMLCLACGSGSMSTSFERRKAYTCLIRHQRVVVSEVKHSQCCCAVKHSVCTSITDSALIPPRPHTRTGLAPKLRPFHRALSLTASTTAQATFFCPPTRALVCLSW